MNRLSHACINHLVSKQLPQAQSAGTEQDWVCRYDQADDDDFLPHSSLSTEIHLLAPPTISTWVKKGSGRKSRREK